MDHEAIKNSLAAYCLGALDEEECLALESHLQSGCQECRALVAEIRQVSDLMPYAAMPLDPPAHVKENLMAQIQPQSARRAKAPVPSPLHIQTDETRVYKLEKSVQKWRRVSWGLAYGLTFTVLAFVFYTRGLQQTNQSLGITIEINEAVIEALQTDLKNKQKILEVIKKPRIRLVDLNGQSVSPVSIGRIFIALDDSNAAFIALNLPEPAADKDYQLWMLEGAKPVDAGILQRQEDGSYLSTFPLIPNRQGLSAFAVTMEPKGGVPQPTGSMYLLGTYTGD